MLHNPTDTGYSRVRVRLFLPYTHFRPLREVAGFRLDVMFPTGPMEFDLPPVAVGDALYQADLRHLLGLRCDADGMGGMMAHATHSE